MTPTQLDDLTIAAWDGLNRGLAAGIVGVLGWLAIDIVGAGLWFVTVLSLSMAGHVAWTGWRGR